MRSHVWAPGRRSMRLYSRSLVQWRSTRRSAAARGQRFTLPLLGKVRSENVLLLFTLVAVVLGTAVGLYINPLFGERRLQPTARQLMYLRFPGEMFLRMLKMLIIPLVIASNISAIASLNAKAARLLTLLSLVYYVGTTCFAVALGLAMVSIIQPGVRRRGPLLDSSARSVPRINVADSLLDLMRNMIPENLFVASFNKTNSVWAPVNGSNDTFEHLVRNAAGTNILGLITFSILFGFAVHSLGADAAVLADVFHAVRRVIIYLVSIVIWFSPVGIMSLIAAEIAKTKDLGGSLRGLSLYVATVMSSLFIHGVLVLPTLLFVVTRRNPVRYAYNMLQALMCALGTASSTATLPCTIRCLESGNQIDPRVTRFMLPLGTTINMDGTAMFQAIATVYIAQTLGQQLDVADIILVGAISALASMAATSMPSAGMITIAMVLQSVGVPTHLISALLPVDWFLDRFRTMVNVFSDSVGAAIVSFVCEDKLAGAAPAPAEDDACPTGTYLDRFRRRPSVHEYTGGLKEADMEAIPLNSVVVAAPSHGNGDVQSPPSRHTSRTSSRCTESPPSCVCMMDNDTILLKF